MVPPQLQLKALQVLPHLILSTIWLSAASEMILSSVLSKVMGWKRNSLLSRHKWIDMLTQQSYFHGGFNPIKPSVVVMEVFWFVFSKDLHGCLFYALFSHKLFIFLLRHTANISDCSCIFFLSEAAKPQDLKQS